MTTSAVTAPRALTAYLRRATWGLPPTRQQELWDELEEHVLTRTDHLTLTGLSPTQAMTQAIHELGPTAHVTLGMAKVYTMPKLLLAAGTLALGLSAGLYALAGGNDRAVSLPVFTRLPAPICQSTLPQNTRTSVVSSWEKTICFFPTAASGIVAAGDTGTELLVTLQTAEDMFTALGGQSQLQKNGVLAFSFPSGPTRTGQHRVTTRLDGIPYFPATVLVWPGSPIPQELIGYRHPSIKVGAQLFRLTSGMDLQTGPTFYDSLSDAFLNVLSQGSISAGSFTGASTHPVTTRLQAGEVVMAVTHSNDEYYQTNFTEVLGAGRLSFRINPARIAFVSDPQLLKESRPDGRTPVLLVRVSNIPLSNLKAGIFVPAQPTSDAR